MVCVLLDDELAVVVDVFVDVVVNGAVGIDVCLMLLNM